MGRRFKEFFEVPDHGKVGYTLTKRGKFYVVRFIGPRGDYERISTGMREQGEARNEAERIVNRAYCPIQYQRPVHLTWDELLQKLQSAMTVNGNRPTTYLGYEGAIRAIRAVLSDTTGPLDIGPYEAQRFKDEFLSGGFTRGKGKDAAIYKRSPVSFNSYLRSARSVWSKWLVRELKMGKDNPWLMVSYAKADKKRPEAPDENVLLEFFQFVKARYPNWDMPILFLQTKCFLGCRLMDLCSVSSAQLQNGVVSIDPEHDKTRNGRAVKLPPTLHQALDELKGPEFLWERFPEQFRACLYAKGSWPRTLTADFVPDNLADFIGRLFTTFQKETGKKLKSHMLRKRAITLLFMEGVSAEVAAKALNMDVQTLRIYYLDMEKVETGELPTGIAGKLIPKV